MSNHLSKLDQGTELGTFSAIHFRQSADLMEKKENVQQSMIIH